MSHPYRDALKRRLIRNEAGTQDYLDFQTRCVRKFGSAAGIFLRQLVYWVGKEHDKEGWIYKTQSEMEKETGLTRKQQEKARKILCRYGVLKEDARGLPRRLWYWVDLEALLQIMETPHSTLNQWARKQGNGAATKTSDHGYGSSRDSITEHTDEVDSMARASRNDSTHPASEDYSNELASEDDINGRAITESTSETTAETSSDNYSSENSNFQFGEDHASRGLSREKDMKISDSPKSSVGGLELNRIYYLLVTPDSEAYRAYEQHRGGRLSLEDLASEVCFTLTGSRAQMEFYVEPVQRMVAELAIDEAVAD